jgi:hypothetical protein
MPSRGAPPFSSARILLGALIPVSLLAFGVTPSFGAASPFHSIEDDVMEMTEFFETILPGTLRKYNLVLDFTPRFTDFRNREFIRYPLELRYGISENSEVFGGFTPFSPNPFNHGEDHRWGLGEVRFGGRKSLDYGFGFFDQATIGIETRIPVGNPPIDLNDGYLHVRPFLTATRRLHWPHTEFFTAASYDRAFDSPHRDQPTDPRIVHQHIAEISPGILYKPGQYGYFFEYDFRDLDEDDGYRLSHGEKVGVIWDMPRTRSKAWHLPGKWEIEMAFKVVEEEGRSINYGIDTHVRVRTTLREVMSSELTHSLHL